MMRLLTRNQSRRLDQVSMERLEIPGLILMENAGKEVAKVTESILEGKKREKQIAICCGKGNNGGDGFSAALHLNHFNVTIFSLPAISDILGDSLHFYNKCVGKGMKIVHGYELPTSNEFDLIIDGLIGTGFSGEMRSPLKKWTKWINQQDCTVVSIDIPSGVNADTGSASKDAVEALLTVTMGCAKVGMMLNPGSSYCGEIYPAQIGFPDVLDELEGVKWRSFEEDLAFEHLTKPDSGTYKHRQGKVLILAGSNGMTGAATLSTTAAMRSGVGLTMTSAPESLNSIYETNLMEGMTFACKDDGKGYLAEQNFEEIHSHLDWCDVILIGPGLGAQGTTRQLIKKIILSSEKPLVIDADGLRCFIDNHDLFQQISAPLVITPHYGELASILGQDIQKIQSNFPDTLESFLKDFPGVIVAKNAPTCTGFRNEVVTNTTGNPGLATAGTGDVLAGIISSFLAQGIPAFEAAQCGVYIHGLAGDIASGDLGYRGLLAGDLLETIPEAIKQYEYC